MICKEKKFAHQRPRIIETFSGAFLLQRTETVTGVNNLWLFVPAVAHQMCGRSVRAWQKISDLSAHVLSSGISSRVPD